MDAFELSIMIKRQQGGDMRKLKELMEAHAL